MSVLHCVIEVSSSEMGLLAQSEWPALDATMVQSSLPSWSYATLQKGVGIGSYDIDIDLLMLLLLS